VGVTEPKILRNVMMNLLSNAIKFSNESQPILVSMNLENDKVRIQVQDHGAGIPGSELPRLFERFHRASNAINIPGTGLGLSIVKKCLELLGGDIHVESTLDVGTTFFVQFKLS
jgi:signal transduction histidine kinase